MKDETHEERLSDQVIGKIQDMILHGELKKGDKLPPERTMTESLGVSRTALREALKSLEVLGLVERRHGAGNYIVDHVHESYFQPLSISFALSHGSWQDIWEMRCCLERYAVQRAAQKATPTDILSLRACHSEMMNAPEETAKAAFDLAFHQEIVRIAGNVLLYNTFQSVSYLMDRFFKQSVHLSYRPDDSVENIYREHEAIIAAIEAGDGAAAVKAVTYHLSSISVMHMTP